MTEKTSFAAAVRAAGLPLTLNMVVHRQNLDGVPDDDRDGAGAGRAADRDRACAVLRLGAHESRCAAADPRAARRGDTRRRGGARAAERRARDRLCRAGLSRRAAEILHERLGPAVPERHAVGQGRALPRRRDPAGHRLPLGARQQPGRHLVPLGGLQPVSRHRLDGRALPQLRAARDRLGRLPLPGLPADRRCGAAPIRSARCRPITAWSRRRVADAARPPPPLTYRHYETIRR